MNEERTDTDPSGNEPVPSDPPAPPDQPVPSDQSAAADQTAAADQPASADQPAAAEQPAVDDQAVPAGAGTAADGEAQAGATSARRPAVGRARRRRSFWKELPILIAVALVLAVVIKTYALQAFFIPSGSMENTLEVNDRVLINKLVYDFRGIHRGDIVVFDGDGSWDPGTVPSTNPLTEFFSNFASMFGFGHAGDIYVKRVVGLPGDHVACCDAQGRITVNNVPLNEGSYLYPGDQPSASRFDIVVPAGQLWVMGDHRSVSSDSRDHLGDPGGGTIPEKAVLGRAFIIIWPPSRWRILPIPATFEQPALNKQVQSASGQALNDQLLAGVRLQPSGPALPLSLGFTGAVPLTWAQRRLRHRFRRQERESS
jgi:signal peptidase I